MLIYDPKFIPYSLSYTIFKHKHWLHMSNSHQFDISIMHLPYLNSVDRLVKIIQVEVANTTEKSLP
jgi:hypothetical protein